MTGASLRAEAGDALRGIVAMPGDKSISHRAFILAALADGESRIKGASTADDVARTIAALRQFGAALRRDGADWLVRGARWRSPCAPIDCGNAGTAARLLIGAAAGCGIDARFVGDASLSRRPMGPLLAPLRAMGARIEGAATLPLAISGGSLHGISHRNHPPSAQVKSALLLAGLGASGRTGIVEPLPTRDHLERMLPRFGVPVERTGDGVTIRGPASLHCADLTIPGDISASAFPLVAALLVPGSAVTIANVGMNPLRTGLIDTLHAMGAAITVTPRGRDEPLADLTASSSKLRGVAVPAGRAPSMIDEYPALAIAAACAQGETVMHGVGALRDKESDRIAALLEGLTRCGVAARADKDTLIVRGGRVRGGARVDSRGDHRIAMAFLILGLVSEAPITVDGAEMIATSFPDFAATMRSLGARIGPA